jgi:hypothetical protein
MCNNGEVFVCKIYVVINEWNTDHEILAPYNHISLYSQIAVSSTAAIYTNVTNTAGEEVVYTGLLFYPLCYIAMKLGLSHWGKNMRFREQDVQEDIWK